MKKKLKQKRAAVSRRGARKRDLMDNTPLVFAGLGLVFLVIVLYFLR